MVTTLDMVKNIHHHELRQVARIQETLLRFFNLHGCKMVETPVFEPYDLYSDSFPYLRRQFIKTFDNDGSVLVLRPDVTMPLVKSLAQEYKDGKEYLKFAYITNVFLDYQGRHRGGKEFLQGGAEILGSAEPDCDSEMILMAMNILQDLKVTDIQVDIGTVAYSEAFFRELKLPDKTRAVSRIKEAVESRNMDAIAALCRELKLKADDTELLLALPTMFGVYGETIGRARSLCRNAAMEAALDRLEEIVTQLQWEKGDSKFYLDFAFSNRVNYYTDMVFKIYAFGAPYELVSGGRYDGLASKFGVPRPACGFGMNINLLYEYIAENHLAGEQQAVFDLLIRYNKIGKTSLGLINSLRKKGLKVVAVPTYGKINEADYRLLSVYDGGKLVIGGKSYTEAEFMRYWTELTKPAGRSGKEGK